MMARKTLLSIVLVVSGIVLADLPSFATAKKKTADKPDPAIGAVEKVLRAEVAGQVDRREKLADALSEQPESASARWQSGYVRNGDSWRSFDQMSQSTDSDSYTEYLRLRRQPSRTPAAQLNLANFCRDHGLPEQERAHLSASLPAAKGTLHDAT